MGTMVLLSSFLWLAAAAWAGDGAGNGDAVVCFDERGMVRSVELLDYFERKDDPTFQLDLGGPALSVEEKVELAIRRLHALDPEREARYAQAAASFGTRSRMVQTPLEDYHVVGKTIALPPHCKRDQIAIHRPTANPSDPPILINEILWKLLKNDDHRAGVRLHEILYEEALRLGHSTSEKVRHLNALLSSQTMETLSASAYERVIAGFAVPVSLDLSLAGAIAEVRVGVPFRLDLNRYLKSQVQGGLTWSAEPLDPTVLWLTVDRQRGILSGTPEAKDQGRKLVRIVVRDEERGALGELTLQIAP